MFAKQYIGVSSLSREHPIKIETAFIGKTHLQIYHSLKEFNRPHHDFSTKFRFGKDQSRI